MTDRIIPRAISGRGNDIYDRMISPLLNDAHQYDRVTSYYSPHSLAILLDELVGVWKRGGTIRLIIGFHETLEITPALRKDLEIADAIREAVTNAMKGVARELCEILTSQKPDIMPVLREIINQKGLSVLLVTPRVNYDFYKESGTWPSPEIGVFHSKFAIIHHEHAVPREEGLITRAKSVFRRFSKHYYRPSSLRAKEGERFSVIIGSMNESVKGYTENIEDAVLHRSWVEPERGVCEYFLNRFEKIWAGHHNDVVTMPFTEAFGEVLKEVDHQQKIDSFAWSDFAETISNSPIYQGIAFPTVGLLPHQIGVYTEALSRWPIRVLLADEVGLGKTIEAGSIIYYLIRFCGIRRVLILTPASLKKQWQQELKTHFGLDFWVYNSSRRICENGTAEHPVGTTPLSYGGKIDKVIVSWHWARMGADEENIRFNQEEMPDLLIVDESHHARIHESASGEYRTQLFELLKKMQEHVPHVVLLTATPYQTDILDYYSLLDILGVPDGFRQTLHQYARWVRGDIPDNFSTKVKQLRQMHQFMQEYGLSTHLSALKQLEELPCQEDTTFYENLARATGELPRDAVIASHPTTLLATRNYRSNLARLGYRFPTPHLESPGITVTDEQKQLFKDIEEFIQQQLGRPERKLASRSNIGLMRSLYRQRMVSSVRAASDTLHNRMVKLEQFINSNVFSDLQPDATDEYDSSTNDEYDSMPNLKYGSTTSEALQSLIESARTEFYSIKRLLAQMDSYFQQESKVIDPKMTRLRHLLKKHISEGRKVLVFSRFTSTTTAIVDELTDFFNSIGVGRFDGQCVGICKMEEQDAVLHECSRKEIVEHLKNGTIGILVCSDAASEGLNLHSANVAINVDVPWNPSRLMQRFGRVDRLGQKAEDVYLTNLYYPGTIEERMYKVLEDRRTDFRAVLGEVPEILSQQQKKVISDLGDGMSPMINLTFDEIEREREEYRKNQILGVRTIDVAGLSDRSPYRQIIQILEGSAIAMGKKVSVNDSTTTIEIEDKTISMDPLDDNFVGLSSPELSEFEHKQERPANRLMMYQLEDSSGQPLSFVLMDGECVIPIISQDWPKLFKYFFRGEPLNLRSLKKYPEDRLDEMKEYLRETESWIWPNQSRMRCISAVRPEIPGIGDLKIGKELGYVNVRR